MKSTCRVVGTRIERTTLAVVGMILVISPATGDAAGFPSPAAVSVIGRDVIEKTPMTNIKEAIVGTPGTLIESKSQGYDARFIIRGAGLKARYAIREVIVLLNGLPITDPDSLTRIDFVDTHLVERIEVVRGPNSTLWEINSTGGAINVVTRSPFDGQGGSARIGVASYGALNLQAGYTGDIAGSTFCNVNVSRRQASNNWREWNEFDTTQFTLQPSWIFGDGWVWENFISYTDGDLQLPGSLVGGIDLQADYDPGFGVLTGGVTVRLDSQDPNAFTYADVLTTPDGRILSTLSDRPGDLMRTLKRKTTLYGIYAQESMRFGSRWLVDVGARVDRITFDLKGTEWIDYDWSDGSYVGGVGPIDTVETYPR